jgi:hypothetical protein
MEITDQGRFEGLDPWDFFLWPQSAKNMKTASGINKSVAWQITIETLPYDNRRWKRFLLLFYWEDIQVWCWLISLLLDRRSKSVEMQSAHLTQCEWNLLGLNISQFPWRTGVERKCTVLERMSLCEQKLYEDPRNECITTGSFPACAVMWVSYICDPLGYSQHLGNVWSKSLIYTHHH